MDTRSENAKVGRKGFKRQPEWVLVREVGPDQVWRQPDWNTVHYKKPYYRVRLGSPWQMISFDTEDGELVDAILKVCGLLREGEKQTFRKMFLRSQAEALAKEFEKVS